MTAAASAHLACHVTLKSRRRSWLGPHSRARFGGSTGLRYHMSLFQQLLCSPSQGRTRAADKRLIKCAGEAVSWPSTASLAVISSAPGTRLSREAERREGRLALLLPLVTPAAPLSGGRWVPRPGGPITPPHARLVTQRQEPKPSIIGQLSQGPAPPACPRSGCQDKTSNRRQPAFASLDSLLHFGPL